ncbi:MAG: cell division protein ZipA C-terminal FtsZ-binding domain-containing protein [Methylomonas sp.]|jgi:cell division protein ZipA
MDKELLRVVIILIGMLVMIGMLLWHFLKSLRGGRREPDEFEEPAYDETGDDYADEPIFKHGVHARDSMIDGDALLDDDEIRPRGFQHTANRAATGVSKSSVSRNDLPKLIEFKLIARDDRGFNGEDLFEAFETAGLEYGSVKVFERVDKFRMVHFAVASMKDPGTFPDINQEKYYCPGIVFFLQPREVESPAEVFEDFIETIDVLAEKLDGVVCDHQDQPVTAETLVNFRQMLVRN